MCLISASRSSPLWLSVHFVAANVHQIAVGPDRSTYLTINHCYPTRETVRILFSIYLFVCWRFCGFRSIQGMKGTFAKSEYHAEMWCFRRDAVVWFLFVQMIVCASSDIWWVSPNPQSLVEWHFQKHQFVCEDAHSFGVLAFHQIDVMSRIHRMPRSALSPLVAYLRVSRLFVCSSIIG